MTGIKRTLFDILEKKRKELGIEAITDPTIDYAQRSVDLYNLTPGILHEKDGFNCAVCLNKGHMIYLDESGYQVMRDCECMNTRRTIRNMQRSGLENIIRDYTFDKFIAAEEWQKSIKQKALEFTKEYKNNWFFIGGQPGAGKTMLCTAICRELLLKGVKVKYMLWKEESTAIKANITDSEHYRELTDTLKNTEVLYIDDFFKPVIDKGAPLPPTAADINLAFEILDYRKNANLPTIISSERFIQDIVAIDEATGSRIVEKTTKKYLSNVTRDKAKNYRLKTMNDGLFI